MTFRFLYSASPPGIQKYCLNYFSIIVEMWEMHSYYDLHFPLCSIKLFQCWLLERKTDKEWVCNHMQPPLDLGVGGRQWEGRQKEMIRNVNMGNP